MFDEDNTDQHKLPVNFDGFEDSQPAPPSLRTNVALLRLTILNLEREVTQLRNNTITKDQFQPIKLIVYGMVSTALAAIVAGILSLIITSAPNHKSSDLLMPPVKPTISLVQNKL